MLKSFNSKLVYLKRPSKAINQLKLRVSFFFQKVRFDFSQNKNNSKYKATVNNPLNEGCGKIKADLVKLKIFIFIKAYVNFI